MDSIKTLGAWGLRKAPGTFLDLRSGAPATGLRKPESEKVLGRRAGESVGKKGGCWGDCWEDGFIRRSRGTALFP